MEEYIHKGNAWKGWLRNLCFAAFGITAFSNPLNRLDVANIVFGIVIGMFFGFLFKKFLRGLLGLFNRKLKKDIGKAAIIYAVNTGMIFMVPFALMALLSVFYLKWSVVSGFISAGIMAVGTAASLEMGKLRGKQEIKNTIVTSLVSYLFSFLWTISAQILVKAPGLIDGAIILIRSIIPKGGGFQ